MKNTARKSTSSATRTHQQELSMTPTPTPATITIDLVKTLSGAPLQAAYREILGEEPNAKAPVVALRRRVIAGLERRAEAAAAAEAAPAAVEVIEQEEPAAAPAEQEPEAELATDDGGTEAAEEEEAEEEADDAEAAPAGHNAPIAASAGPAHAAVAPAATARTKAAGGAPRGPAPTLPPVGTVLIKRDARTGKERARCEIVEGGVMYAGKLYTSLSGAAIAALRDLGGKAEQTNGLVWWGVKAKGDGTGAAPAPRAKDHANALAPAWERFVGQVGAALEATAGDAEARARLHAFLTARASSAQELVKLAAPAAAA